VREGGTSGEYELAYGHHRIEALKQLEIKKLTVVVQELSNDQMLQMMANENSEEYGHDFALGVMNAVEALVKAYAAGQVELEVTTRSGSAGPADSVLRYAPSFVMGNRVSESPYSPLSVARFLGWTKEHANKGPQAADRVITALQALELIERKVLTRAQLRGLGVSQARDLITLCKRREQAEAEKLETQREFLKKQAADAQKANDVNKQRSLERKLDDLANEAPKAIAKAGKEAISAVKEFYDPAQGMAAALRAAADKMKLEAPKAKVPKAPKVVDLSSVETFAGHLDGMLQFDDGRWQRVLRLAAETTAVKQFKNLEDSLLKLAARAQERVKELKKARS